jgi:hypothetical protein
MKEGTAEVENHVETVKLGTGLSGIEVEISAKHTVAESPVTPGDEAPALVAPDEQRQQLWVAIREKKLAERLQTQCGAAVLESEFYQGRPVAKGEAFGVE